MILLTKSSAELIGFTMFSTVRKAAKLAVYELIKINVKNHHAEAMSRAEGDFGEKSAPCCSRAAKITQ